MTNSTAPINPTAGDTSTSTPGDPRPIFRDAVALATSVIDAVPADRLDAASPCPGLDARGLLGHLAEVLDRLATIGEGGDPFAPVPDVMDDAWAAAWRTAAARMEAVWADDEVLIRTIQLPWSQVSGARTLCTYVNEVTVHTWDLAQATGQRPAWDDRVVAVGLAGIQAALPAEGRNVAFVAAREVMERELGDAAPEWAAEAESMEPPFAEVVPVPADSPLIDRLVAWNGRNPHRQP